MFKEKLKKVIKEKGITQTKLCDLTGISKSCISQYVNGYIVPTKERQMKIARALELPEDYFLGAVKAQKEKRNGLNMPVDVAAGIMGISNTTLRIQPQQGLYPWGVASKGEGNRYVYYINKRKFAKEECVSLEEIEEIMNKEE